MAEGIKVGRWVLALAVCGAWTGCVVDTQQVGQKLQGANVALDGLSGTVVQEFAQMGATAAADHGLALAKSGGDIDAGETGVQRAYDSGCGCWIRDAQFTDARGDQRHRVDSVTFLDAAGAPVQAPDLGAVKSILHIRHVTAEHQGKPVDLRLETLADIAVEGADTVGTWNGTIAGTYGGEAFRDGTISGVTRMREGGRWAFPAAGLVTIHKLILTYEIAFPGDGLATATVYDQAHHVLRVIHIDRDFNENG